MISVLIRTHNRSSLLKKCISSVLAQTFNKEYEIVIIDSASIDDTKDVIDSFSQTDSRIRYIYEPIAGAARARRKGLDVARGDILVWIDDDCIADKNWLNQIIFCFENYPDADIVGGQIILNWETGKPTWLPKELESTFGQQKYSDNIVETRMVNGANIAYKSVIAKRITTDMSTLGPSGGAKRIMSEDAEFCSQARISGGRIYFTPYAIVYHFVSKDQSTFKYFIGLHYALGRSEAVRYRLKYPNNKIDCVKRILKGWISLLKQLIILILIFPYRLISNFTNILLEFVPIVRLTSYIIEENNYLINMYKKLINN